MAVAVRLDEVDQIERGLAEELVAALLLQSQHAALDGADACGGDVAVLGRELLGVLADVGQHRTQVLEVEQEHAVVVGDAEDEREDAGLGVVQVEQAAQEQRPHLRDGRADGMALLAEDVPEDDWASRRTRSLRGRVA